jgi:hypothetical protein
MSALDFSQSPNHRKIGWIILILLLLLIGGCFFLRRNRMPRTKPPGESIRAETPAASPPAQPAAADVRPTPTPINYEAYFIQSVKMFQSNPPADDARLENNRGERARGISNSLPGTRTLTGWIGTLHQIQPLPGGKVAIAIELPESTILLRTWSDVVSDAGAGTLIDQKSDLYHTASALKVGAPVFFDGEFLEDKTDWAKEGSESVREGFTSPKYIVRFKEIRSARK